MTQDRGLSMRLMTVSACLALALSGCVSTSAQPQNVTPNERVDSRSLPRATFGKDDQAFLRGRVTIETPAVHELTNVIIALTNAGKDPSTALIQIETDYWNDVRTRFGPFIDHPAVRRFQALLEQRVADHMAVKVNASAYALGANGQIKKRSEYTHIRGAGDAFAPYKKEIQDFADETGFPAFFNSARSQETYARQRQFFQHEANIQGLLDWLRAEYPGARPYETVRVVVSPLVFGWQHQDAVADGDFRQLIAHVNYPLPKIEHALLSEPAASFDRASLLFTELNHGFIELNDQTLRRGVQNVFGSGDVFVNRQASNHVYDTGEAVFLEYINWALISVYACENFSGEDCKIISDKVENAMTHGRGFTIFGSFQNWLLEYRAAHRSITMEELTPLAVNWFEAQLEPAN